MEQGHATMAEQKTIAVVAHDNKKPDLLAWAHEGRRGCDPAASVANA